MNTCCWQVESPKERETRAEKQNLQPKPKMKSTEIKHIKSLKISEEGD